MYLQQQAQWSQTHDEAEGKLFGSLANGTDDTEHRDQEVKSGTKNIDKMKRYEQTEW